MNKITVVCHKDHDKGYEDYVGRCLLCEVERLKNPQQTPLTDEEIDALREKHSEGRGAGWRFDFKGFARAIESAHGIKKNT